MDYIKIKGARQHNLKNISLNIPRHKFVVITGLSGSGKSSLAFDTIYAEGQRRYIESFSGYARQFLPVMEKPDVDSIEGLSPTVAISEVKGTANLRSTVGTITEIYDALRLLYARCGVPLCFKCRVEMRRQSIQDFVGQIKDLPAGTKFSIIAPVVKDKTGEHRSFFKAVKSSQFYKVKIDGQEYSLAEAAEIRLNPKEKHTLDVVVGRLTRLGKPDSCWDTDLNQILKSASEYGDGTIIVEREHQENFVYSRDWFCSSCRLTRMELEPRVFSFNNPEGACLTCHGLGTRMEASADLVIPNKKLSIAEGAIKPLAFASGARSWQWLTLEAMAKNEGIDLCQPVKDMAVVDLDKILYGVKEKQYSVARYDKKLLTSWDGVLAYLNKLSEETESSYIKNEIERYLETRECPTCRGRRLRQEWLLVLVSGKTIAQVAQMSLSAALEFFLTNRGLGESKIAKEIIKEIIKRLVVLNELSLGYLVLDRSITTLSGGEAQRVRLAAQVCLGLTEVIYILDEPSRGLHPHDHLKLINLLKKLKDSGNTVIVVEHDKDTIESADYIIDLGPGAGEEGGRLVACGTSRQFKQKPPRQSLTAQYLAGKVEIKPSSAHRSSSGKSLIIHGVREHNLKNIDVKVPLGKLICITGVSGSGKSTLVTDILSTALARHFYKAKRVPGKHKDILGLEHLSRAITVDQSPIGRSPRSNPATYTGVFAHIRDFFAQLPEAKIRGYDKGHFSFNTKRGRCSACAGEGAIKAGMHFLPEVYLRCEECQGKHYRNDILEVHFKEKNIADILEMSVNEALDYLGEMIPETQKYLRTLQKVGLGYLKLGQPATNLSGGEAQRLKLASELYKDETANKRALGRTLYILDEPTVGLHFEDIRRLLLILEDLVSRGNTVIVVEHNLEVIKSADWVIDLGPEGGEKGGYLVACGTPREVALVKESYTGQCLKKVFS